MTSIHGSIASRPAIFLAIATLAAVACGDDSSSDGATTGSSSGGTAATGSGTSTSANGSTSASSGSGSVTSSGSGGDSSSGGGTSSDGGGGTGGATTGTGGSGTGAGAPCVSEQGSGMVRVPAGFCMDVSEVANADYESFLAAAVSTDDQEAYCAWNTSFVPPGAWPSANPALPVTYVDWCDAAAYCKWAGKRLCGKIGGGPNDAADFSNPDASEWYSACSDEGALAYPYGNTFEVDTCNGFDNSNPGIEIQPVTSTEGCETAEGIHDLSGNVWEWEDGCSGVPFGESDVCRVRGGSFEDTEPMLECGYGQKLDSRGTTNGRNGIRCCAD